MNRKGQFFGIGAAIVTLIGLVLFVMTFGWVNVHPTEVAVEINKVAGKISDMPKGVGYHFFNRWVTDMVIYKVSARAFPAEQLGTTDKKFYELDVKTKDGQNVRIDFTLLYALRSKEVPQLHQQVGSNYEDQIILPQIRSETRLAIGAYSAEELYQGKVRDEIQIKIKEKLVSALIKYPAIEINDALIRNFDFSNEFEKAIEQKKLAAQQIEINKNLALAAEENAKTLEANARGEKLRVIQGAQGEAEAKKVNADAERYKLEQEAAGKLAGYKADAEGKKLQADALGGGKNVVALKFAEMLPPTLKVVAVPVGQSSTSIMDLNGVFKGLFSNIDEGK